MSIADWLKARFFRPAAPLIAETPPIVPSAVPPPAAPVASPPTVAPVISVAPVPPIAEPPPAALVALPEISALAEALIEQCEITSQDHYAACLSRPAWPEGESGVTIGIGYDLGYHSRAEIQEAWGGYLSAADLVRLAACAGKKGADASAALEDVRNIDVPFAAARAVFRQILLPNYARQTLAAFPGAVSLPPDCFGALVSLVFNRGPSLTGDRRREMRQIAKCLPTHPELVPDLLRSMRRLWEDERGNPLPGMAGLVARRQAEAKLFEAGLATAKPSNG